MAKSKATAKDTDGFTAADYAYTPNPDAPGSWKLRLTSTPGGDPDPAIVGAACAALGPGFRGQKVEIPDDDLPAVKGRVRAAWRKANPGKDDDDMPEGIQEATDPAPLDGRQEAAAQAFGDPEAVEPEAQPEAAEQPPEGERFTEALPGHLLESLDGGEGRIWRVTLIKPGTSLNGRRYRPEVLAEALPLYEGAKCFDGHRTGPERAASSIHRLVGWHQNVALGGDGSIQADLHLTEAAEHVRHTLLTAWRNGRPDLVGFSHDVVGIPQPAVEGGRAISDTARITAVNSVDVVADPAAGGRLERLVASRHDQEGTTMDPKELAAFLDGLSDEDRAAATAHLAARAASTAAPAGDPAPAAESLSAIERRIVIREALEGVTLPPDLKAKVQARAQALASEAAIQAEVKEAADLWSAVLGARAQALPGQATVEVGQEALDNLRAGLDGMLEGAPVNGVKPFRSLREAHARFTGANPLLDSEDYARRVLAESAGGVASAGRRLTESVTAATWSSALGDSITRKAIKDYLAGVEAWGDWRKIVSDIVPVQDFSTQRREGFGFYNVLSTVGEGAPYPALTSPTDVEATYSVSKKGGTEDLTLEAIANDDIGLVRRIPQRLGRSAALTLARAIWITVFQSNGTIYDSVALFDAAHANLGTTAIGTDGAGLTAARNLMVTQTAPGETSGAAGILPRFLCYPPELFATVHALLNPAPGRTTETPWTGLQPIEVPLWTDANDYMIVADPRTCPTIEVGFLNGREEPEVIIQDAPAAGSVFTADKVTWKVRHIWGLAVLDYRGFVWEEVA